MKSLERRRGLKIGHAERELPIFSELGSILEGLPRGPMRTHGSAAVSLTGRRGRRRASAPQPQALARLPAMPARLNLPPERPGARSPGAPRLRTDTLRHTYCAARLPTLDRAQPIAPMTLAREMGRTDLSMVWRISGHLRTIRHRGDEVSYASTDDIP